ncbi:MAG: fibrobacter succinogenes major paralogous domain-containing protein, partial [Prevotellaceae bacterium]|nr:fibrobacter succinogenes major paralogous domain-containing protein [Prevotellaceae bacterium]
TATGGTLGTAASYQFGTGSTTLTATTATTYTLSSVTATATYWVKIVTTSVCAAPGGSATRAITVYDLPTISTHPAATATCANGTVKLTVAANNATAYQWRKDGVDVSEGSNYNTATYTTATLTATATYSVVVTNGMDACSTTSDNAVVTVHKLPTITLASGSSAQTVTYGNAMTQIKYNAANATGDTVTGLPTGVSGAWASNVYTISGTATGSGTYSYTVTTTNGNGCTNAKATGNITVLLPAVCVPKTLTLGTVGRTNSNTYKRNGITVAAPVTASYCDKATYAGGSSGAYQVDCRNNTTTDLGHLFSWCLVVQYADKLCPSPWRVPSRNDFCNYAGLGNECTGNTSVIRYGMEGWLHGGYSTREGELNRQDSYGYYWSATEADSDRRYSLQLEGSTTSPATLYNIGYGFSLRCVR